MPQARPRPSDGSDDTDPSTVILTPFLIQPPSTDPSAYPLGSFGHTLRWSTVMSHQWPTDNLDVIRQELYRRDGRRRETPAEENINHAWRMALCRLCFDTEEHEVGWATGKDVGNFHPGPSANESEDEGDGEGTGESDDGEVAAVATPPPPAWKNSPLQKVIRMLRLDGGDLKPILMKRRRDDDDDDGDDDSAYEGRDDVTRLVSSFITIPTTTSDLVSYLSYYPRPLPTNNSLKGSKINGHTGLLKPDLLHYASSPHGTCMTLTGERKDDRSKAAMGLVKAVGYALTAFETFGTRYGVFWYRERFVRLAVVDSSTVVFEADQSSRRKIRNAVAVRALEAHAHPEGSSQGQTDTGLALSSFLFAMDNDLAIGSCPWHMFDETGNVDPQGVQTLWNLFMHTAKLTLQHPVTCPRIPPVPNWGRMVAAWRERQQFEWDHMPTAAAIVQHCYPRTAREAALLAGIQEERSTHGGSGAGSGAEGSGEDHHEGNDRGHRAGGGARDDGAGTGGGSTRPEGAPPGDDDLADDDVAPEGSNQTNDITPGDIPAPHKVSPVPSAYVAPPRPDEYLLSLHAAPGPEHQCLLDAIRDAFTGTKVILIDPSEMTDMIDVADRSLQKVCQDLAGMADTSTEVAGGGGEQVELGEIGEEEEYSLPVSDKRGAPIVLGPAPRGRAR